MHLPPIRLTFVTSLCLFAGVSAQDALWIANRTSGDVMQISPLGEVLQTLPQAVTMRTIHRAPDGKLWVAGSATVPILHPDGSPFGAAGFSLGSSYAIAFDRSGHAWVSGGTGVEEFDANGTTLNTYPLSFSAPLGIAIDADGNKWICHRAGPPGSVTRIDGMTGAISNHPMPSTSLILPTRCCADFRGLGMPSHVWVVGDNRGAGELIELDASGTVLNTYVLAPGGAFGSVIADVDPATLAVQFVWVGDFRTGDLWRVDAATGAAISVTVATDVLGLTIDGFRNVWATARTNTELRRIDVQGFLEAFATIGAGAGGPAASGWETATTVDPLGDFDGDAVPNIFEIQGRSSPFDACSTPAASLSVEGAAAVGGPTALQILATGQMFLAFGLTRNASPLTIPGIACTFDLDPTTLIVTADAGFGTQLIPFVIPNAAILVGNPLLVQGAHVTATPTFTNVNGWLFF
ncbi:MAG: hypothetical protein IPM29_23370 [Planctomycetes bacterium]|nr:hypothetical protein [Planctomycetota bacterium]